MLNFPCNEKGGWVIPPYTAIPPETEIPPWSEIGDYCRLGNYCRVGYGCRLGESTGWLGLTVKAWLTLANVDGSGRQIKIVRGTCGTLKVEAGCFCGSLDDFITRAKEEGKLRYVAVISAIAEHV